MIADPCQLETLEKVTDFRTALSHGATLLTATDRLARHLRYDFEQAMVDAGNTVWPTPAILPWGSWLRQMHQRLIDEDAVRSILLSPLQEQLIWHRVISESEEGHALLRPQAAADAAASAYSLVRNWRLSPEQLGAGATGETEMFLQWVSRFESECGSENWLAQADLIGVVVDEIAEGSVHAPAHLILAGFDELTPAQGTLLSVLIEAGTRIGILGDTGVQQHVLRFGALDRDTEIALSARWALSRLQANPEAKIGIVVPDLENRRPDIDRWFKKILHPETNLPGTTSRHPLFEFSLGKTLDSYPVVNDALTALGLMLGEQPLQEIGRFLCSPFFTGGTQEWALRGALDARLRDFGRARLSFGRLHHVVTKSMPRLPKTEAAQASALTLIRVLPNKALPSEWANQFDRLLNALGWPGERGIDSDEFQTMTRFRELYLELVKLDLVCGQMTYPDAVSLLRRIAARSMFQPKSHNAPVQVLGVLEAGGMRYDHLWVMSLDDSIWPPPATPHPLLPCHLQRRLGLPHASAERELVFADRLTERLRHVAPEVIFSHPLNDADRILRPSPLIMDEKELTEAQLKLAPMRADRDPADRVRLETIVDAHIVPPPATLRGGTQLLAAQSICPFSAVAGYRLRAQPLSEPQLVPDGRFIGSTVHRALDLLWRELKDQSALLAMSSADLQAAVGTAVDTALAESAQTRPDLYTRQYVVLERERLIAQLLSWLDVEGQRSPFSVSRLEADETIDLEGLQLKVRADRIDVLEDGSVVVIDYKTAKLTQIQDWTEQRITQPQVPLYCISSEEAVAAGVLGRLRTADCGFTGLTRDDGILPGIKAFNGTQGIASWPELQQHWCTALSELAREVRAGRAAATPSPDACRYCPFAALCRLYDNIEMESSDD